MPEGSAQLITTRALSPDQLLGVPDNVIVKVSQFTPSTHVLSSSEPPPAAVPTQFNCGPPGLSVPEAGCAECSWAVKNPNTIRQIPVTKKSAPIVARAPYRTRFFVQKLQVLKRFLSENFRLLEFGVFGVRSADADRDENVSL